MDGVQETEQYSWYSTGTVYVQYNILYCTVLYCSRIVRDHSILSGRCTEVRSRALAGCQRFAVENDAYQKFSNFMIMGHSQLRKVGNDVGEHLRRRALAAEMLPIWNCEKNNLNLGDLN